MNTIYYKRHVNDISIIYHKTNMTTEEILDTLNKLNFNKCLRLPNHQKKGNAEN
jgi:hypothetical protein